LSKVIDGVWTELSEPQEFKVVKLREGALPAKNISEINAFRKRFEAFQQDMTAVRTVLSKSQSLVSAMSTALSSATNPTPELAKSIEDARNALLTINRKMNGSKAKNEIGERNSLSPGDGQFVGFVALGSTYGPTGNHVAAFERAVNQLAGIKSELKTISEQTLPGLRSALKEAGAPWIEGEGLK
ncbi:MAG: glycosyl hydrolase, partial [Bacteroidota bacterium]